jgi:hypothetical protein
MNAPGQQAAAAKSTAAPAAAAPASAPAVVDATADRLAALRAKVSVKGSADTPGQQAAADLDSDWRVKRDTVDEEVEEVDWSKGLGKGIDIPEYLWWKKGAHIQLKNLNKRATELFIMEIWKAKKIADAMKNEKADIHKFIMQHCQKKYGNFQNIIVENMASLMRAVEIHKEDADIEMFGEILAGRLDENVCTAQVLLILPYSVILPHTFRAC